MQIYRVVLVVFGVGGGDSGVGVAGVSCGGDTGCGGGTDGVWWLL